MGALELRTASDGTATISGTASVYGVSYDMRAYREVVARGAATATLASNPDVLLRIEHQISIARTPTTLQLREDAKGLHYMAQVDPVNDGDARTAVSRIERRVYTESSFAFRVPPGGDSWNSDFTQRTITRFDIDRGDVAICAFGASPTTTTAVQRAFQGGLGERRDAARAISRAGWCGPLVGGVVRGWSNQFGSSCDSCQGTGACPDCDGVGWVGHDEDDDRSARTPARETHTISRTAPASAPAQKRGRLEDDLYLAQARLTWAREELETAKALAEFDCSTEANIRVLEAELRAMGALR